MTTRSSLPQGSTVALLAPAAQPVLGDYRIERALGHGSIGRVFVAIGRDGRRVALKTFDLRGDDGGEIAAVFERESLVALSLVHPGIVRSLTAGCEGSTAFLAMEFIAGGDFTPHTRPDGLLPIGTVLNIGRRVTEALAYAHDLGIVHRDIKPANILLHADTDTVKVADFGLARLGDVFRSRTGIVSGTPHYMSPEQLAEGEVDARADLYALGVVLFEALCGRLPHQAESLGALLRKVASETAPPLRALRPEAPLALESLVSRLLSTAARERPANAAAVASELAAIQA